MVGELRMNKEERINFNEIDVKIYEDKIRKLKDRKNHINRKIKKWEGYIEKIKYS